MKTYLLNGFLLALSSFLLLLVIFVCGLQSDPAHLSLGHWLDGLGGMVLGIFFLVRSIRARRAEVPAHEEFGYGWALWAGVATQLFTSVFSAIFAYIYTALINPHLIDITLQAREERLRAGGLSSEQIERTGHVFRMISSPGIQALGHFFGTLFVGGLIVLIAAAFLRRPVPDLPPPV